MNFPNNSGLYFVENSANCSSYVVLCIKVLKTIEQKRLFFSSPAEMLSLQQLLQTLEESADLNENDESATRLQVLDLVVSALEKKNVGCAVDLDAIFAVVEQSVSTVEGSVKEFWPSVDLLADVVLISFIRCTSEETNGKEVYFKAGTRLLQVLMNLIDGAELDHSSFPKVAQKLFQISEKTCHLELKTMATYWKFFLRLLPRSTGHVSQLNPHETLAFLCAEVHQLLQLLIASQDNLQRMIKVGGFYLRSILSLLDIFSDALDDTGMIKSLFELVMALFDFTGDVNQESMFQCDKNRGEFIRLAESQLGLAITPFLRKILLCQQAMKILENNFDSFQKQNPLSLCRLLSKLLLPQSQQHNPDKDALHVNLNLFLRAADDCHAAFSGNAKLFGVMHSGQPQRLVPAYELLCTEACAGMAVADASQIQDCVVVLLEHVVEGKAWAWFMASDILCFIARFGTSGFCQQLVHAVLQLLNPQSMQPFLPKTPGSSQYRLLVLVNRLVNFLSNGAREALLELYQPEKHIQLWAVLNWSYFPTKRHILLQRYTMALDLEFSQNPVKGLLLLHSLLVFNSSSICEPAKPHFTKILQLTEPLIAHAENSNSHRLHPKPMETVLSMTSCCVSHLINLDNQQQLHQVLRFLSAARCCSGTKLFASEILREMSGLKIAATALQQPLLRSISSLFNQIVASCNPMVRCAALRSFTEFARRTPHTTIVPYCVKNEQQPLVSDFLQNPIVNPSVLAKFLERQASRLTAEHKQQGEELEEGTVESVTKKPRLDESPIEARGTENDVQLGEVLRNLENSLIVLERRKESLPVWARQKLSTLKNKLNQITK